MRFTFPLPPSANTLFVNNPHTGGRFPSKLYSEWKREAGFFLIDQAKKENWDFETNHKKDLWEVTLLFHFAKTSIWKCDVDNRMKPTIDLLCKCLGLEDRYLIFINALKLQAEKEDPHVETVVQVFGANQS